MSVNIDKTEFEDLMRLYSSINNERGRGFNPKQSREIAYEYFREHCANSNRTAEYASSLIEKYETLYPLQESGNQSRQ